VFANQTAADWAVVDADDPLVLAEARRAAARKLLVRTTGGRRLESGDGAFFEGDAARLRLDGREETLFLRADVAVPGAHLAGDLLVAAAAARLLGADPGAIARGVRGFRGVPHVLELVATVDGVSYYDDSKATNVDAARRSLEAFDRPVVVILGGRYKGGDFADLAPALAARGRRVIAIGEAAERVRAALAATVPVQTAPSLPEAVAAARASAFTGDVVLLAPACSSFDMFRDYAERGRAFKDAVARLAPEAEAGARG
jgi:UDP-N-acetylmuramoylalanine--D-glutamate ligase